MSTEQVTKPFDLEAAKAGKPVCTKWGLPVRIVCWDVNTDMDNKLIGLVTINGHESDPLRFTEAGVCHYDRQCDLRMAPEILTQWVNVLEVTKPFGIFKKGDKTVHSYRSEEEALSTSYPCEYWKCIARAKRVDIEL
jgi:hypothetical protein